jgi:hypothetical protein
MAWVRLADLSSAEVELSAEERIDLVCTAMEEWAVAKALVNIHGEERGAERYKEAGGHIRFDADGEPVIWYQRKKRLQPPAGSGKSPRA